MSARLLVRPAPHPVGRPVMAAVAVVAALWAALQPDLAWILIGWVPYLAQGFAMNVLISVAAIAIGSLIGLILGVMELAPARLVRAPAITYVHIFRNAPHLVLIFATTYAMPFEITLLGEPSLFPTG